MSQKYTVSLALLTWQLVSLSSYSDDISKMRIEIFSEPEKKLLHKNYDDHDKAECPVCNSEIELFWEPRYDGIRGTCTKCGINWAES